jgi:hypothetical protein
VTKKRHNFFEVLKEAKSDPKFRKEPFKSKNSKVCDDDLHMHAHIRMHAATT